MSLRILVPIFLFVLCFAAAPGALAAGKVATAADAVSAKDAVPRLKTLKGLLGKRNATNEEIRGALEAVMEAFSNHGGTPKERDAFRASAGVQIARALTVHKVSRRDDEQNVREEIVVKASEYIAAAVKGADKAAFDTKARAKLAAAIRKAADARLKKLKPRQLSDAWLDAVFGSLAALGDDATYAWFIDNFVHARTRETRQLVAAHKAMALIGDAPGKLRHRLTDLLLRAYEGLESASQQNTVESQPSKRLWDDLRRTVIPLLQTITGQPQNEDGVALSSMREFRVWWKAHKRPGKAPWRKTS